MDFVHAYHVTYSDGLSHSVFIYLPIRSLLHIVAFTVITLQYLTANEIQTNTTHKYNQKQHFARNSKINYVRK